MIGGLPVSFLFIILITTTLIFLMLFLDFRREEAGSPFLPVAIALFIIEIILTIFYLI